MLKNKEFLITVLLQGSVLILGVIFLSMEIVSPTWCLVLTAAAIILVNIIATRRRYAQIKKLTEYISDFQYGEESLDLLDNREGELSILKNQLYKLCLTLLHQKELLRKDKIFLANAISDISHQLRTPLTSITVMADLLEQQDLSEQKRKQFTRNILNSLERMRWLIESLLKISKLDAGSVVFKRETVKIQQLIKKACSSFLVQMDIQDQMLVIEGEEALEFDCDIAWTLEAISNIVKNCMEHTGPGGTIRISYSDNHLYTSIVIEDTGVGIAKEDLPHIFERFYRGKNASIDSVGIGLALSKSIVTEQKGVIEVESEPGVGTTFRLKFYR
ncbi:MAG: HAMP domain-containing sensor histidine kinase [bacterium]|nr:HAMP domain-containing sensor histidine kinase [bacterium]